MKRILFFTVFLGLGPTIGLQGAFGRFASGTGKVVNRFAAERRAIEAIKRKFPDLWKIRGRVNFPDIAKLPIQEPSSLFVHPYLASGKSAWHPSMRFVYTGGQGSTQFQGSKINAIFEALFDSVMKSDIPQEPVEPTPGEAGSEGTESALTLFTPSIPVAPSDDREEHASNEIANNVTRGGHGEAPKTPQESDEAHVGGIVQGSLRQEPEKQPEPLEGASNKQDDSEEQDEDTQESDVQEATAHNKAQSQSDQSAQQSGAPSASVQSDNKPSDEVLSEDTAPQPEEALDKQQDPQSIPALEARVAQPAHKAVQPVVSVPAKKTIKTPQQKKSNKSRTAHDTLDVDNVEKPVTFPQRPAPQRTAEPAEKSHHTRVPHSGPAQSMLGGNGATATRAPHYDSWTSHYETEQHTTVLSISQPETRESNMQRALRELQKPVPIAPSLYPFTLPDRQPEAYIPYDPDFVIEPVPYL